MTTGPQHYTAAEQLLQTVQRFPESSDAAVLATAAMAHATLALAAATAMAANSTEGMARVDFDAWDQVAGVPEGSNR